LKGNKACIRVHPRCRGFFNNFGSSLFYVGRLNEIFQV
jgi:hypothetical protein